MPPACGTFNTPRRAQPSVTAPLICCCLFFVLTLVESVAGSLLQYSQPRELGATCLPTCTTQLEHPASPTAPNSYRHMHTTLYLPPSAHQLHRVLLPPTFTYSLTFSQATTSQCVCSFSLHHTSHTSHAVHRYTIRSWCGGGVSTACDNLPQR